MENSSSSSIDSKICTSGILNKIFYQPLPFLFIVYSFSNVFSSDGFITVNINFKKPYVFSSVLPLFSIYT